VATYAQTIGPVKEFRRTKWQGCGGIFEVALEGRVVFSKKKVGRFPQHDEILTSLRAAS
jgi:selT/selW/selH-like putative selenoprotein